MTPYPSLGQALSQLDARSAVLLIVLATTLGVASVVIYRLWLHPLAHFPGPKLAAITNLHQCYRYLQGNEQEYYKYLHDKYGPVVRFGPNSLMTNQPRSLPVIYWRRADKTGFYNPNFGTVSLFSTLDHEHHVLLKRRIAAAYSMASIRTYEYRIDDCISTLTKILHGRSGFIELEEYLHWFAYDVISAVLSGKPMGFLDQQQDVNGLINSFGSVVAPLEFLGRIPKLSYLARKTWLGRRLFHARAGDANGIGILMTERDLWYDEHVSTKRPTGTTGDDLMYKLGGSATVSEALKKLFANLLQTPRAYDRLVSEIDEHTRQGQQSPSDAPISFDQAQTIPYLRVCIRESFRLSPSTPLFPRTAPPGGLTLGDHFVPEGTAVAASPWVTMRDKAMYGEDAETYRPERWLEAPPIQLRDWDRYDFHWGYGNRTCLGKHIAVMEIYKVTYELIRHFDFALSNGDQVEIRTRKTQAATVGLVPTVTPISLNAGEKV